jgi:NhaP-type Na+/H+ or K+/H+ antiporter
VDITVQIFVTFATAYISFILSASLGYSGVLSASAAGLALARLAPPFMLQHERMEATWHVFEWVCNTLIFFFGGLAAALGAMTTFRSSDLYLVPVAYILVSKSLLMLIVTN